MKNHLGSDEFSSSEIFPAYIGPYDRLYASSPDNILWGETPTHLLKHILPDDPPGTSLDVGCGDGVNSIALERAGFLNTGVDISELALRGLRNRASRGGVNLRGRYYQANLERGLESNSRSPVDVLVSCGLYHCFGAHRRIERHSAIFNVVRPGGLVLFSTLIDEIDINFDHGTDAFDLPSLDEVESLFEGLEVVAMERGKIRDRHPPLVGEHEHAVAWVVARKR